jgi:hypothetical protein
LPFEILTHNLILKIFIHLLDIAKIILNQPRVLVDSEDASAGGPLFLFVLWDLVSLECPGSKAKRGSTAACHMAESEKKIFKLFISNYVNFVLQQILVQGLL